MHTLRDFVFFAQRFAIESLAGTPIPTRLVMLWKMPCDKSDILKYWLELSWVAIQRILGEWTLEHLPLTYVHTFRGTQYKVTNQWTLWRIMSHDLRHRGQIAMMLSSQNIPAPELRTLEVHIVVPPLAC